MKTISDLVEAEKIVSSNPNLSWDGWSIIHLSKDDYAEFSPSGIFDNKTLQWYKKTVYPCTETGWEIPESVI